MEILDKYLFDEGCAQIGSQRLLQIYLFYYHLIEFDMQI
jgi:hypothetical protein